ncbi:MAG: hypothetical protein C5B57_00375 [Blastocatellia bacterium]|nr:MAG: hypothetical protein C5B57_00375 [Blastocatellia bacterium]
MKLIVLGGLAFVAAVGAGLAAQGGSTGSATEQTIMGCVKGDGTDANPWMLTGVVIPPPPPPAPPGGPGGGRGARGGGREGGGREGGAPPAEGRGREGAPAAGGEAGGRGRGAAPATPPPPPPPPQDFKLTGINMTPWNGGRAQVTGTGTPADFKVSEVRSMWGTCKN